MKDRVKSRKKKDQARLKGSLKKVIFAFFSIILIALLILGIYSSKKSIWSGRERITFALHLKKDKSVNNEVFMISFSPIDRTLNVLKLPSKLKIEDIGGYGKWRVN
jgi:hypothetical protein